MYYTFPCPKCEKRLKVREETIGRKCACPFCKTSIVIPPPLPTVQPPPPAPPSIDGGGDESARAFQGIGQSDRVAGKSSRAQDARSRGGETGGGWAERTEVSMLTSGLLGIVLAIAFYVVLLGVWGAWLKAFPPITEEQKVQAGMAGSVAVEKPPEFLIGKLFVKGSVAKDWVPAALVYFFCWSVAILVLKSRKVRRQRASMLFDLLPTELGNDITVEAVGKFIDNIRDLPVKPGESFLVNRVLHGLEHFGVRNSNPEVAALLTSQSEIDGNAVQSSYTLLNVFIWAIPILGFIGTVIGISAAVASFSGNIDASADVSALKDSLGGVTTGLATAFETTLIALVMSILVMFPTSSMQKAEEDMLNSVDEYCNENLLKRFSDGSDIGASGQGTVGDGVNSLALRRAINGALAPHYKELEAWSEKLESIGDKLTSQVVRGWGSIVGQIDRHQRESTEQILDLDTMAATFLKTMEEMGEESRRIHRQTAESLAATAQSLQSYCEALEGGLAGLNDVLSKLGEKQVVIQNTPRRRWFFGRR